MAEWISRQAADRLATLAGHLRIVLISGPRQSGKTSLLRAYVEDVGGSFRSLDEEESLRAAQDDPAAFVAYGATPRGIDEVQRGGESLVRAMKLAVDEDSRPGRFLLSGSTRFLSIPTLSESLAGRIAFLDLWPLSIAERTGGSADLLDRLFVDPPDEDAATDADDGGQGRWHLLRGSPWNREDYLSAVLDGGFPEALRIPDLTARRMWYEGYLATVINRDIRAFADINKADAFGELLALVATRAGGITVESDLAQHLAISRDTTKEYLGYADLVYLTTRVPAWSSNRTSRIVKAPKTYPVDSGLAAHLVGVGARDLAVPGAPFTGELVETFVANELTKAIASAETPMRLHHLRTTDGREVDFVLEGPGGELVAFEVKASTSPGADAVKGLRWLRDQVGDRLRAGILLHLGRHAASRGDGIYTLPLSALWGHRPLPGPPPAD